jgi:hypothetical protein
MAAGAIASDALVIEPCLVARGMTVETGLLSMPVASDAHVQKIGDARVMRMTADAGEILK